MDLTQSKLTKAEWLSVEIPVSDAEKETLQLIQDGFHNVHVRRNTTPTLASVSKMDVGGDYLYRAYVEPTLVAWSKQYGLFFSPSVAVKTPLKTRDLIRIKSLEAKIGEHRAHIYEFVVLELCRQVLEEEEEVDRCRPAYTLMYLQKEAHVPDVQTRLMAFVSTLLERYPVKCSDLLQNAYACIEKNPDLFKYKDRALFAHQRQLFHLFRDPGAKLVLYTAPTGTGKTLSPLGLSEGYRVIFICAARHVGLALAKAAVSVQKRIAVAFGCETASDIRLHYFAASEFTRNRKSGGIGKVNNAMGDKVQIMICDVQSYLVAMHYMMAFSPSLGEERDADLVTYWDEPTITMDYVEHPLHAQMQRNWQENQVSKVVLSCATLPKAEEIGSVLGDFASRFPTATHHTIQSFESAKSISLWNTAGQAVLPHLLFDGELLRQSTQHCLAHRELLRYMDLSAIVRFIEAANPLDALAPETYFSGHSGNMTMQSIKEYYLVLLQRLPAILPSTEKCSGTKGGGTLLTTKDAHTLTDGPAIFLAEDVEKVGRFLVQQANIPATIFQQVAEKIAQNSKVQRKMDELEQQLEDIEATESNREQNSAVVAKGKATRDRESAGTTRLVEQMEALRGQIRNVSLDPVYVPNTVPHQRVWVAKATENAFVPSVDPGTVREIMALDVTDQMKLLLLMGIGMFVNDYPAKYVEIMKRLAQEQRLFLILASSDYIYGTNFNFCHGFVGKDLDNMTFQKTIQAMGRIGRSHIQQEYTVRFRDDDMLRRLFLPSATNPEADKMNELFRYP